MAKNTSLMPIKVAANGPDPVVVIQSALKALDKVAKAFDSYIQFRIERERTAQLKLAYKADVKKAELMLTTLQKKINLNLKYLKYQSDESEKHRRALLKQMDNFWLIARRYQEAQIEAINDKGADLTRLNELSKMIVECFSQIGNLAKALQPHHFATIGG